MEYMMKNMFGFRWNCKELKGIVKLRFFTLVTMILHWLKDGWRTSNRKRRQIRIAWSTYLVNMSPSSAIRFKKPIDMLGFFGWLASIKQRILEPVKFKCISLGYHKSIVANKLWRLDDVTLKVVLYRNIGFNESGEYKKTFIGNGVGTGSVQVLHGFEFEVKPQENVVKGGGLQEAGLKDDMDARSDVYVLSNGCRKCSDDSDSYYWKYTPAKGNILNLEIIRDQSGNTLRVSQSRIHNEKLVQTFLKGHSTLSLEDSLSMDSDVKKMSNVQGHSTLSLEDSLSIDCDVKKNDKRSYICSWKPGVSDGLHET
uniref:Zinc finger, CCHC-type n=1 Tax=Tanacetum cinerariifolium TaxID=118510 RepID=A0A699KAD5_TANCI|nr:zinc finger, CCHC-type [Tanacetum cinerariifolium]